MKTHTDMVKEFHEYFDFPIGEELELQQNSDVDRSLSNAARSLNVLALTLKYVGICAPEGDHRAYRAHLMVEELGEVLEAMKERSILKLADALGDLKYTTIGTEITYNIPGELTFSEIHRSNMTKNPPTKEDPRMKNKGEKYEEPNLEEILSCRD